MKIYRLREAKTSQLKKLLNNGNITEEQFQIADEFFKKYSAFEKEIDWNRGLKITWDDLKSVIYKERNSESQTKKKIRKGLEGFEEGKDYVVLEETDDYVAYQPFTWEASRMIASHYVEPSRNEDGEMEDARWCTAYQKDRSYWDDHNLIEAFIYICGESIPSKKVAISISRKDEDASGSEFLYSLDDLNFNIWDFEDYNYTIEEEELLKVVPDLYSLINKAYKNWNNENRKSFLSKLKLNPKTNRYDYDGDLDFSNGKLKDYFLAEDGDGFIINFGEITGDFICHGVWLTSLKGAPTKVGGDFGCSKNSLTSLKGSPQTVGQGFYCFDNQLTSLEGAPEEVAENFDCSNNHLTSLKGLPKEIVGYFDCSHNELTSLKGSPQEIGQSFYCSSNQLTSLQGAPQKIGRSFSCSDNQLTSLEGSPQEISGHFNCSGNQLTSLEGAPQEVGEEFYCSANKLTSLEGAPREVGGDFYCANNQLTSLEGAPDYVGGDFNCKNNPNLYSLDGIGKVLGEVLSGVPF